MRFIVAILFVMISMSLSAKPRIVATTTMIADMCQQLVGDSIDVISIMPVGGDPHLYDPVPTDATKIVEADLILKNGLSLEGWLDKLIDNSGTNAFVITVSEGVKAIVSEDHDNSFDPHIWMNAKYGIIMIQNILDALIMVDPSNKGYYLNRFEAYREQLLSIDVYIHDQISQIPEEQRFLITSHDAFRYYGNAYGLKVQSILGTSTEAEARIEDVTSIINLIEEKGIKAVFVESTINPKLMKQLSNDRGVVIGGGLFADSLDDPDQVAGTYLGMLKYNTDVIVNGLLGKNEASAVDPEYWFLAILALLFFATFFYISTKVHRKANETPTIESSIQVRDLSASYEQKRVLNNINLNFEMGKIYGVVGPNGSGKSTLFKSILGLIPIDTGEVSIDNKPLSEFQNRIAYIPQKEEVDWSFPVTVQDLVLMGAYPNIGVFQKIGDRELNMAKEAMEKLEILHLKDRQIGELSGGQQQRAFIARAVCQQAEIYFMDEPFVGVDMVTEEKIVELLKSLSAEGKMIIIIHHDLSKVEQYFDDLVLLNRRVVAFGKVEEVFIEENIQKVFSSQLPLLQEKDKYIN